jgi:probable phosphoglycerate mutase
MPTFLLIRHGENEYVKTGKLAGRLPGVHLNERGHQQAAKLAKALKDAPISAVYSSPMDRTMETAEPIADALNQDVIVRKGLLELDFGKWQDKKLSKLRKKELWKTVQSAPSHMRFPDGESFAEAQLRAANEIKALAAQHDDRELVVCVGHSDLIKLIVAYFIGLPLDQFQRLMISTASITTLFVGKSGAFLINMNHSVEPPKFPKPPQQKKAEPEKGKKKKKS